MIREAELEIADLDMLEDDVQVAIKRISRQYLFLYNLVDANESLRYDTNIRQRISILQSSLKALQSELKKEIGNTKQEVKTKWDLKELELRKKLSR